MRSATRSRHTGLLKLQGKTQALRVRARIVQAIRAFFVDNGFLEMETPQRIPAPAPEAHIDAVPSAGWWLQTSPELCMKRLLAAGFPKIFQLCRCWRDGERGALHLPEFTMLEWYRAGADYHRLMQECEQLICGVARELGRQGTLCWRGREVDLSPPWPRVTVDEVFLRYAGVSPEEALERGTFDETVVHEIEPRLAESSKPVFLVDYPAALGALARKKSGDPRWAERFELYIAGLELANAFSELTDPAEQAARFEAEREERRAAGKAVYSWPEPFLTDLGFMPESAGIALGVDRLVMLLTGARSVDEVVAFTPEEL